MTITFRKVLTVIRRHAKLLLPPDKDIPQTGRKGFRGQRHGLATSIVLGFLHGIVTERGLERYLCEHKREARLCGLQTVPSDTTLGRTKGWITPELLEELINRPIKEIFKPLGRRRTCISVDCSPLEAYRKKDPDARWGFSKVKGWFFGYKLHAAIDAVTGLPLAVIVTSGNEHGMNHLPALLWRVRENGIRFRVVVADSGYDGEDNYKAIAEEFNALVVIKRNERNTKDGITSNQDSLRNKARRPEYGGRAWKRLYNMRTSVERFFSILKDTLKLEHHRMEGLHNITLWCLFAVLAMLAFALASIRQGLFDRILKVGTFVYR